jgi:hypothetical protein
MTSPANAPHFDIATKINADTSYVLGADLFGGEWGDTDEQVLILDGVASASELKDVYEEVSIQALVRGKKCEAAHDVYLKAKVLSNYLLNLDDFEVNGCGYKLFEPSSNIAPLGKDDNERHTYSMNFLTYRAGVI